MDRYRSYGAQDDQPAQIGDNALLGVDEYNAPENIKPGNVQNAVNVDFSPQDATTRGGFVCLPELGSTPFGQVWTSRTSGTINDLLSVVYGNGFFLAGSFGAVLKSADGINWSVASSYANLSINQIAFGNGVFVAVGIPTGVGVASLITSTDGVTWTVPATAPVTRIYNVVEYGNGIWCAFSNNAYRVFSTDNGATWSSEALINLATNSTGLTFGNGTFLLSTTFGRLFRSNDGDTWTRITTAPSSLGILTDCVFGNQIYVLLALNGGVYISSDLTTWTQTRSADTIAAQWNSIIFDSGRFLAIAAYDSSSGSPARVMSSITGSGWMVAPAIPQEVWRDIVCGGSICVGVGDDGKIITSTNATASIYGSGLFSDPNNPSEVWTMLVGYNKVGFYASAHTGRSIPLASGEYVTQQSTIVQANNQVYLFRGAGQTPLYWDGNWNGEFVLVPDTALPSSFNSIPSSNQATFYQNRLWVVDGKDEIAASDVLAFTDYDPLANELSTSTGNSDYVVATFPFGQNSLIAFKNKSIQLLQNCEGSLSDVTVTEITRQVGLIGINAVCSVGPDLAYASYGNINLLTLTSTNNSLQHKTLPLSAKVRKIMDRVNWQYGYKISMGYWSNKLYVALPLDNSIYCNGVIVYNFITENWYGEWNFADSMNMCIQGFQVLDYLGLQRLHAITEDGRIFVTDEGYQDISGTTVAEIAYDLTTRAYDTSNLIHFQRRMFMDTGTIRPSFSVYSYTEGANEVSTLIEDQTYSRSESWKFADTDYTLTNANDDYNRPYRKDYSTGPDSIQCGTGFQPEMYQEYRFPLLTRRQGRLTWLQLTNAQGYLKLMSIGAEARMGQRSSLVTV